MGLPLEFTPLLLLSLSLSAAPSTGCEWYNLEDFNLPAFKDKAVSDFLISTHQETTKLWMCYRICQSDSRCRAYQFNHLTDRCSLFAWGLSQPDKPFLRIRDEAGWQSYRMVGRYHSFGDVCSSSIDCDYASSYCRDGRCECVQGYSYNPNSGSCVTQCDAYGNAFEAHKDKGIAGYNNDIYTGTNMQDCMQACVEMTAYECRSIDYKVSESRCQLSAKAWFDVSAGSQITNAGWYFVSRHCALQ